MTTAALEAPTRRDPRADGPTGRAGATTGVDAMAVAALVARPLVIFFATTGAAFALVTRWSGPGATAAPATYPAWLAGVFPLPPGVGAAAADTAQLAASSLVAAAVLGLGLGLALRSRHLAPIGARLGVVLLALTAPVVGLTLHHWLLVRFQVGLRPGSVPVWDDPARAFDRLLLPALTVGVTLAPAMAAMVARAPFTSGPYGGAAMASPLASRAAPGDRWRRGVPAGLLLAGLLTAEVLFARDGILALIVRATSRRDEPVALAAVAVVALTGAVLALAVDLAGARSGDAPVGRPPDRVRRLPPRTVRVAAALPAALVVAGAAGLAWGRSLDPRPAARLSRPLFDGVLGTDGLGRDLLALAASGLGQAVLAAAVPALGATLAAAAVVAVERLLPRAGGLVWGVVVDALWWPLPVTVVFAGLAFEPGGLGLVDPRVLALVGMGLIPLAARLIHRAPTGGGPPGRLGLVGVWLFVAPAALLVNLVAAFAGFDRTDQPSLGYQLNTSLETMAESPWPALVPGVTVTILAFACFHLGSCLTTQAWHRSSLEMNPGLHGPATGRPLDTDRPAPDGDGTTDDDTAPDVGAGDTGDTSEDRPAIDHEDHEDHEDHDDAVAPGHGGEGLRPNFDLQPGLPAAHLSDTLQLPVVRVTVAPPSGPET